MTEMIIIVTIAMVMKVMMTALIMTVMMRIVMATVDIALPMVPALHLQKIVKGLFNSALQQDRHVLERYWIGQKLI